jgi:hypothetical protein
MIALSRRIPPSTAIVMSVSVIEFMPGKHSKTGSVIKAALKP